MFLYTGSPLWRENGYVIYNPCWLSIAEWLLSPCPAIIMTIFYSIRIEIPPSWKARSAYLYASVVRRPSYDPRNWIPSSRQLQQTGLRWRRFNPSACGHSNPWKRVSKKHNVNRIEENISWLSCSELYEASLRRRLLHFLSQYAP
jgi:hypothetical protein